MYFPGSYLQIVGDLEEIYPTSSRTIKFKLKIE